MTSSAYAVRARQHYQQHLPTRYQALTDPEAFFDDLGALIAQRVAQRERDLMDGQAPGPGYLDNLAALNTAHVQAEDEVLRDLLPPAEAAEAAEEDSPAT